ncbi:hypothetical protein BN1050_02098 [Metalysinibacillus saudimassiliensis]|uniref:DUF3886 domain-containing protein n=1 Tax=Metalysinibacillus saudimassiliensis TaxID=1461583 RepID=A0A078MBF2_9BACL|nr:hypothetical protein BN1050_02098 [Metalysinibacillus saudimassiliensis]
MAKKRGQKVAGTVKKQDDAVTIADQLGGDMLEKLAQMKKDLTKQEEQQAIEREEQLRRERKEREKNKTFEELLDEYGDMGSKF